MVLGILPPRKIPTGTFHPGIFPQGMFPPPTLFRFVGRFARVRIEDSSRNRSRERHISCKARQRCFHAYFSCGECSEGETTGVESSGGNFPGGNILANGKTITSRRTAVLETGEYNTKKCFQSYLRVSIFTCLHLLMHVYIFWDFTIFSLWGGFDQHMSITKWDGHKI